MATAIEDSARVDHHARRMNFTGDHAFGLNLDSAFGEDNAVEAPGNHYAVSFYLTFDLCGIAEDHGLLGNDIAFDVAVDAERAGELERAFQRHSLIDEACPFLAGPSVVRGTQPLESHTTTPVDSSTLAAGMRKSTTQLLRVVE